MMEKTGWALLALAALIYIVILAVLSIAAFPFGILGLIVLIGLGLIFAQVIKDRMSNKDDDYYSKNVDL